MKHVFETFYKYSCLGLVAALLCALDVNAAVVSRPTAANRAAAARVPNRGASTQAAVTTTQVEEPEPEPVEEPEPIIVDNKSALFGTAITETSFDDMTDSDNYLARQIQEQIAAYDKPKGQNNSQSVSGAQICDTNLRSCMKEKCGADFTKCAKDNTVAWGAKMDACRTKTSCTGHEYALLAPEILADRDMNVRTTYYKSVKSCGQKYNNCIWGKCGNNMQKCLAKQDEDKAVSACASIARGCREQDSGLVARMTSAFGELRSDALNQAKKDEQRLYDLRDLMRSTCQGLGAAFDDRTLDCVYTASFFAANLEAPVASKKLYAGDTFKCNPDWFGVDVTTFLENASRTTRAQKSASMALLGSSVGTAAGLLTSGAIQNAWDTVETRKEAKEACEKAGKKWEDDECVAKTAEDLEKEKEKADKKAARQAKRKANQNGGGIKVTHPADQQFNGSNVTPPWESQYSNSAPNPLATK
jgi:hypothetical protein